MKNTVVIDTEKLDQILANCESLRSIVHSNEHILGMDEIEDLYYFIGSIEEAADSK